VPKRFLIGAFLIYKAMTFKEIYYRIIPLWEENIDFSDGMYVESKNSLKGLGKNTTTPATNLYSGKLSKQWNAVEDTVGQEDTFGKLMVWTMYQVFQRHATRHFEQNIFRLKPAEVDKKEIEEQYFKNLSEETWEKELSQYERIIE
jgi:hypothetical protein